MKPYHSTSLPPQFQCSFDFLYFSVKTQFCFSSKSSFSPLFTRTCWEFYSRLGFILLMTLITSDLVINSRRFIFVYLFVQLQTVVFVCTKFSFYKNFNRYFYVIATKIWAEVKKEYFLFSLYIKKNHTTNKKKLHAPIEKKHPFHLHI